MPYIIFAAFGGDLSSELVLEFLEAGHDALIAADSQISEPIRWSPSLIMCDSNIPPFTISALFLLWPQGASASVGGSVRISV